MNAAAWVILPTYNEIENLERIVVETRAAIASACGGNYRILIVDDNSPDGTGVKADELATEYPEVEVLHRHKKAGLGQAYLAGFERALTGGAEYIFEMDCDFSHSPSDLPRLLEQIREGGSDLALGSRYVEGGGIKDWGLFRRTVSRAGCWYARCVLSLPIRDLTGGLKCFQRRVLEGIDLTSINVQGYVFQIELTYRAINAGFKVTEIPIVFRDRERGTSKMSTSIALEAAWRVPKMRMKSGKRR